MKKLLQKLQQYIQGEPAKGLPVQDIKTSTHSVYPDKQPEFNDWSTDIGGMLFIKD
jgi:hypothetical protein